MERGAREGEGQVSSIPHSIHHVMNLDLSLSLHLASFEQWLQRQNGEEESYTRLLGSLDKRQDEMR